MGKIHRAEGQWAFIRPLLPLPPRRGRPRADDRRTIEGILPVLITGCRWQDLPRKSGVPTTVWRRLSRWGEEGNWDRIWRAALAALELHGQLEWTKAFLDGSFVPAKRGGEKVGLTNSPRRKKGTEWMLVIDGNGLPLGFHLDSASRAAVRLAQKTLDTIKVARPYGRPKQPVAGRGYDSGGFRQVLRRRGIRMCIPPKRRPATWKAKRGHPVVACEDDYRERYIVERSFAWLGNFRHLVLRWEHGSSVSRSGCACAVMRLGVRRATALACPIPLGYVAQGWWTRRWTRHARCN